MCVYTHTHTNTHTQILNAAASPRRVVGSNLSGSKNKGLRFSLQPHDEKHETVRLMKRTLGSVCYYSISLTYKPRPQARYLRHRHQRKEQWPSHPLAAPEGLGVRAAGRYHQRVSSPFIAQEFGWRFLLPPPPPRCRSRSGVALTGWAAWLELVFI